MPTTNSSLRVALVHDWLVGMRGGEKVLEHFCRLYPNADLYTLLYEEDKVSDLIREMNVIPSPLSRYGLIRKGYRNMLPLLMREAERLPTADYDLVISTSHCVAKAAPRPSKGLHLTYVFTPMRYAWDGFAEYLDSGFIKSTALRLLRPWLQRWDFRTAQQPDAIAADSRHVAARIRRFWHRHATVLHPSVELERFTPKKSPGGDFFLVVSALVPYKRVERAAQAARMAKQKLIIVGTGPEEQRLRRYEGRYVELRGWLPDEEIAELYRNARAMIYPQLEDYGITALEAQACGTPVIAFGKGGVRDTVLNGVTGTFFQEPTAESLARALRHHKDSQFDPQVIRRHAENFSPDKFQARLRDWIDGETRFVT